MLAGAKTMDLKEIFAINAETKKAECDRIIQAFQALALQMDQKADEDDTETGLVWAAAASCVRRVCNEVCN